MLSISRSRLALLSQLAFLSINAVGLVFGTIYNSQTPYLYENNAHHKLGWIVTWIVCTQALLSLVKRWVHRNDTRSDNDDINNAAQYRRVKDLHTADLYRYSRDSGQGTEPSSPREISPSSAQAFHEAQKLLSDDQNIITNDEETYGDEKSTGDNIVKRYLVRSLLWVSKTRGMKYLDVCYNIIDRNILFLGFITLLTGGVTYGGIFKGQGIFSGLAHLVKGGIFFWYGLLTLGRFFGCFAEYGWSWNIPSRNSVSAEFVESFLIFFYGSTNVFLEHLGSWGGEWSAGDLEHVSISIMFFGGGLCGMLVESKRLRSLLNSALPTPSPFPTYNIGSSFVDPSRMSPAIDMYQPPRTYPFSLNPMPGIIILLLGLLMSGHHQASMVSTMLHKQWGSLFVGAALARGVTYILMYLSPPTSFLPSRPPSELVVAFCLLSGGLIFMCSNSDMVVALETRGLEAMFVFTVMIGFTAFVMAWEAVVLGIKAWAVRREKGSQAELA
jgi:hypothetical protein